MAITQNVYTGDGITVLYTFSWPYLSTEDVNVKIDDVQQTRVVDYTLETDQSIRFVNAPAESSRIVIYRITDVNDLYHVFYPGSAIRAKDLNSDFTQSLFVNQESQNASYDASSIGYLYPPELGGEYSNVQDALTEALTTGGSGGGGDPGAVTSVNGQVGIVNLGLDDLNDVTITSGTGPPTELCYEGASPFTIKVLANGADVSETDPLLKITEITFDSTVSCPAGGSQDFYNVSWVDPFGTPGTTKLQYGGPCGTLNYTWVQTFVGDDTCYTPGPSPSLENGSILVYDSSTLNWVSEANKEIVGGDGISVDTVGSEVTVDVELAGPNDGLDIVSGKLSASLASTTELGSVIVGTGLGVDFDGTIYSEFDPDDLVGEYLSLSSLSGPQDVSTTETTTFAGQVALPGGGGDTEALQKQEIEALISTETSGDFLSLAAGDIDQVVQSTGDTSFSGNVGIGTDTPVTTLEVFDSTARDINAYNSPLSIGNQGTNTNGGHKLGEGPSLNFRLRRGADGVSKQSAYIRAVAEGDLGSSWPTSLSFATRRFGDDPEENMRIQSDGTVGIGTDDPYNKLVVKGSGNATTTSVVPSEFTTTIQTNSVYINCGKVNDLPAIQGSGTSTLYKLLLNPFAGNVGIGTTNPQAKLEVSSLGSAATDVELSRTRITGGTNNPMFRVFANETDNLITLGTNGSNSDSEIQINTTSTEAVRINKDGNVGIGTTDPASTLDIVSTGGVVGITSTTQTNSARINIKGGTGSYAGINFGDSDAVSQGYVRYYNNDDSLRFQTNKTQRVLIKSNGYVGIGTDDPQVLLDVNGIGLFGTDPDNGAGSGIQLNNSGLILVGRAATKNIFAGFLNGSTGTTSVITSDGDAVFSGTVTATNVPASDARFKENITPSKPQLADVVALGGLLKNYDWNDQAPVNDKIRSQRQLGLIAQEVEEVCPSITKEIHRTKQGAMLTPEQVIPAVYEDKVIPAEYNTIVVPAKLGPKGKEIVPASTEEVLVTPEYTERVLITEEQVIPATYEELDDSYKGISQDALIMKLIGAVAELSTRLGERDAQISSLTARITTLELA